MNKKDKLFKLITQAESLLENHDANSNPDFNAWNSSVIRFMEREFGIDSTDTKRLKSRLYFPSALAIGADNRETIYKSYKKDLLKTIAELKSIYDDLEDEVISNSRKDTTSTNPCFTFNINNSNNNENNIKNIINITFKDLKEEISSDSSIDLEEKSEILNKIEEIEDISKENSNKTTKWNKIKLILMFLLDKGVDFVIAYLPKILMLINSNIGG